MRKRMTLAGVLAAMCALVASLAVSSAFGSRNATILIGISAAKTGILAPYDLQSGQLFQMRIDQINKKGGVLGKQIKVQWIDTKSDKPTAATNAEELIGNGAVAIIATCDFDFSFPAINAARGHKVPGIALCASSPKVATPAIVGAYGGSMGLGSDTEGATMAEWARTTKRQWKSAYIFKDTSLEYSKATADYFKARWTQLGGKVCGEDTFVGGAEPRPLVADHPPSRQGRQLRHDLRRLLAAVRLPADPRDPRRRHQDRDHDERVGQRHARQPGGRQGLELLGSRASPACRRTARARRLRRSGRSPRSSRRSTGQPLGNHYALPGYALADALVAAIKTAGSTDGTKIAAALFGGPVRVNYFGNVMKFTAKCHRPQPAAYSVEQWTNGKDRQIGTASVKQIPNIGDGSPCSGIPPKVK